jgi:hypothetical protein
MPESFFKQNCLDYHRVLQTLNVESIGDGVNLLAPDIHTLHLPGHSPDSLAVKINDEALVPGDVILPDISPWPTSVELYNEVTDILVSRYPDAGKIYGLFRYITSLKQLKDLSIRNPGMTVLPAHRLYYQGQWQWMELPQRLHELLEHHIQRCASILDILSTGAKTVDEIAREHFEASLLEGFGKIMAANEIISHCELMVASRDLIEVGEHRYAATGSGNFEELIH